MSRAFFAPAYLARILDMPESEAEEGLRRAIEAGLLTESNDMISICGWDSYWKPPLTSTERSRKRRGNRNVMQRDATDATPGNACNAREERRGEEKRGSVSPSGDGATQRTTEKRKTAIPDGWKPNEKHIQLASGLGVSLAAEAEKFREGALANGRRYVDWNLAFNTWLRRVPDFARGGAPPKQTGLSLEEEDPVLWENGRRVT
jgi:hypothetical protein